MFQISTIQADRTYYYRSTGIRWVTNPDRADRFDAQQIGDAVVAAVGLNGYTVQVQSI